MRHAVLLLAACATSEAAPVKLDATGPLCVTKGRIADRSIDDPTVRAVAADTTGDGASLAFAFRGDARKLRELANGDARRQLGLKLRAQDGCNLVYVMWRLDPKPQLEISIKVNPGMTTHRECGADGYTKLGHVAAPALAAGASHTLRAEIHGDELTAWIDDQVAWRGPLPAVAHTLSGPSGLRSDNVAFDIVEFRAPHGVAACRSDRSD